MLEKFLRKDTGGRFTFIYYDSKVGKINKQKAKFHVTIRNLNKKHSSNVGDGVEIPYTVTPSSKICIQQYSIV